MEPKKEGLWKPPDSMVFNPQKPLSDTVDDDDALLWLCSLYTDDSLPPQSHLY